MNKLLVELLAMLEAIRLLHHSCHLNAQGCYGYSLHLLFERLYGGPVPGEFDEIGEHMIRMGGRADPCIIARQALQWQERWEKCKCKCDIERALEAERNFCAAVAGLIKRNADKDIGLDDSLRSIANSHGTAVMLLQQAAKDDDDQDDKNGKKE